MNSFEYFLCEFIYEAAIHSEKLSKPKYKKDIAELQFLLAKEDMKKFSNEKSIIWN